MALLKTLVAGFVAAATVLASPYPAAEPSPEELEMFKARQQQWATQYWANEDANLEWNSGPGGAFDLSWDQPNGGNFVVGKGIDPARRMKFNYTADWKLGTQTNAYLALYGWTTNPLVEYYVIENFGVHHPADNKNSTCYGTFESDGATYEVWMKWRVNAPSIIGTATFPQYWSVRTKRHSGGTITTGNHFDAWEKAGLPLGTQKGMFIGIEGQWGSGQATFVAGATPTTKVTQTKTPTRRTEVPTATNTCQGKLN
jgi:endo-1,4-beta-xylanase